MTAFARITEAHDAVLRGHTPCARLLYRWLLRRRPAGKSQEIELEEFSAWSETCRPNPYSVRHVKRAFRELIETGVVEVVRRYTSQIFKVVCYHPSPPQDSPKDLIDCSTQNVLSQSQNVHHRPLMSKIGHSNPYNPVPIYREYRETTNTGIKEDFVQSEINKGKFLVSAQSQLSDDCQTDSTRNTPQEEVLEQTQPIKNTPQFSEGIKIDPKLESEIKEAIAPYQLNSQLRCLVIEAEVDLVMNSLKVLEQNKKKREVKNPAGLFRRALTERWTPNTENSTPPKEFDEWFKLARDAGLVMSSQKRDEQLWIFDANAQPFPYDEMLQRYPLESLRASSLQEERRSPFVPSSSPKPVTEPIDFSDILSAIDIQIARLGWGKDKVQQFLKTTYGKISRSLLRDEELMDFKLRLQNL